MKAKVIETGEIIEVFQDFTQAMWFDKAQPHKSYHPNDLEFLPEESKEVTIEGWVARDKCGPTDLGLRIYTAYPRRMEGLKRWNGREAESVLIDHSLFPEVTWNSEPKKVRLTITQIEEWD